VKAKIQADMKEAMKAKDRQRLLTLRGIIAEIKKAEIDGGKELNDDGVTTILQKELKKRRDALEPAKKAERVDLIEQNEQEIEIIQAYLGKPLSDDELKELISGMIADGADALGKIMGALNKEHKGRFDGKAASAMAKELLG
jgi:hypothetical protein